MCVEEGNNLDGLMGMRGRKYCRSSKSDVDDTSMQRKVMVRAKIKGAGLFMVNILWSVDRKSRDHLRDDN
jgi:hypothetical protein